MRIEFICQEWSVGFGFKKFSVLIELVELIEFLNELDYVFF